MRLLVAEDDRDTAALIVDLFTANGHEVRWTERGDEAADLLLAERFDLAILDRMLPGASGMEALARIRQSGRTLPVLMLTALGSIADRVDGLEGGADDYLVKPFATAELLARANALLRRGVGLAGDPALLTCGRLRMDILRREVRYDERPVLLQPREHRLLEEMMRHAGRVMTRAMLLEKVWGFHFEPQTNLVETHMSRLRAKLGHAGARDLIQTVRGAGYVLHAEA